MDFELTCEQKELKKYARGFLRKEVAPLVAEYERRTPLAKEDIQFLLKKVKPLGYLDGLVAVEHGGAGLDPMTYGLLLEELAYDWMALASQVAGQSLITSVLATHNDHNNSRRLIPQLLEGERVICFGLTEPDVGSNAAAITTKAVRDGDSYVVNGTKAWVTAAPHSDVAIIVVVTNASLGARGLTRLFVDREVSPYESHHLHKLGLRAVASGDLVFEDCRVPCENLLTEAGSAYSGALAMIDMGRAMMAICSVACMQAATDAAAKYARERVQFGRPIGAFQLVQETIADMVIETECSRLLTYRTFATISKGTPCGREAAISKAYACETAIRVTSKAIEVHGANGLSDEFPVERYYRDARMMTMPDGTTGMQKLLIARKTLGMSALS